MPCQHHLNLSKSIKLLQDLKNLSKGFKKWLRAACFIGVSPTLSQVEILAEKIARGQIPKRIWNNVYIVDIKLNHKEFGTALETIFEEYSNLQSQSPANRTDAQEVEQRPPVNMHQTLFAGDDKVFASLRPSPTQHCEEKPKKTT